MIWFDFNLAHCSAIFFCYLDDERDDNLVAIDQCGHILRWRWRVRRCWKATRCGGGTCSFSSLYIACFDPRMQGYTNCWTLPRALSKNFFVRLKSDHCLALSVSHSITPCLLWDLMWPWCVKNHATSHCPISCCQFWQKCCWCRNKRKAMLLDARWKKCFCWCWNKTNAILLMPDEKKRFFCLCLNKTKALVPKKWLDQFSRHFRPF